MEKLIVEMLCSKYGRNERLIKLMVKDILNEGYTLKEATDLISMFYNKKSMQ